MMKSTRIPMLGLLTVIATLAAFLIMIRFARAHFFALRIPTQVTVIDALPRDGTGVLDTVDEITVNGIAVKPASGRALHVHVGSHIAFRGWAFDSTSGKPAGGAAIDVDNRSVFPIAYGIDRPDVARAYRDALLSAVGWSGQIPTDALLPGRHTISLLIIKANDEAAFIAPLMTLDVEKN